MIEISHKDYELLTDDEKQKLSKKPISSDDMGTLLKLATELHSAAIARQQEHRWRLPLLVAGLSFGGSLLAVFGTIAAAIIASQAAITVAHLSSTLSQQPHISAPVSVVPSVTRPLGKRPHNPHPAPESRLPRTPTSVRGEHGGD